MKTKLLTTLLTFFSLTAIAQQGTSAGSMQYANTVGAKGGYNPRNGLYMPAKETFIVEDFFNYHKHQINIPQESDAALSIDYNNRLCAENETVVQIGLATQPAENRTTQRSKVNVCVVLDVSSSMSGEKIEMAKKAVARFVGSLSDDDYLSLVTFSTDAKTLFPAAKISGNRKKIYALIDKIEVIHTTNLNAGMMLGYKEAMKNNRPDVNSRVIVITDGMTNVGETNHKKIVDNSQGYNKEDIEISTIGLGQSLDFELLRQLADAGRGSNYFIGFEKEDIEKVFSQELDALLYRIGSNPKLTVTLPKGWEIVKNYGYESKSKVNERNEITYNLDNLNAGLTTIMLLRVKTNGKYDSEMPIKAHLEYTSNNKTVKLEQKQVYNSDKKTTNDELEKNFQIAYMAQGMANAAQAFSNRDEREALSILKSTYGKADESSYKSNEDFKRVFTILENYVPKDDKSENCREETRPRPRWIN